MEDLRGGKVSGKLKLQAASARVEWRILLKWAVCKTLWHSIIRIGNIGIPTMA